MIANAYDYWRRSGAGSSSVYVNLERMCTIELSVSLIEIDSERAIVKWRFKSMNGKSEESGRWIQQTVLAYPKDRELILQERTAHNEDLAPNETDLWGYSQQHLHPCIPSGLELHKVGNESLLLSGEELSCERYDASVILSLDHPRMKQLCDREGGSLPPPAAATMRYWISEHVPGGLVRSQLLGTGAQCPGGVPELGWMIRSIIRVPPPRSA